MVIAETCRRACDTKGERLAGIIIMAWDRQSRVQKVTGDCRMARKPVCCLHPAQRFSERKSTRHGFRLAT